MKKAELRKIIKEELINYRINEAIDSNDLKKLRDIIRAEIASLLFDLFKKRNIWL